MLKRIPLGTNAVPARAGQPATEITYAEVLREVLFAGGPQGLPTPQLLTSLEVWEVIKAAAGKPHVLLSEAQFRHLSARLGVFRWGAGSEEAARFVLDIQEAATVDPNQEPAP
jgi:hypothetical protein